MIMFLFGEGGPGILRYEILPGESVDELTLGTLRQNPPRGVFVPGRETTEEIDHLLIPIAGLVSLTESPSIVAEWIDAGKLLWEVDRIRAALKDYMIPEEELVLRPDLTFLDPETGEVRLLCLPIAGAGDRSLPREAYEVLVRDLLKNAVLEDESPPDRASAKSSAKSKAPSRPLWQRVKDYWENLD